MIKQKPTIKQERRGRRSPAGNSVREAARKSGVPLARFRRAIKLGQVATIDFGGILLVTDAECERVHALYFGKMQAAE